MSESGDKLIAFSRRQPTTGRRQRVRKVQKPGPKPVANPRGNERPPVARTTQQQDAPKVKRLKVPKGTSLPAQPKAVRKPNGPAPRQNAIAPGKPPLTVVTTGKSPTSKTKLPPAPSNNGRLKAVPKVATAPATPIEYTGKQRKRVLARTKNVSRKTQPKPMARVLLYILRLLIIGAGVGALVGTVLSVFHPATRISSADANNPQQVQPSPTPTQNPGLNLSQEIPSLKNAVENLMTANPKLTPGVLFVDLENGNYVDVNASASFSAASTIKFPLLIAFFEDVDAGKIRLDEKLTMEKSMVAGGSGDLRLQQIGSKFTALEVADKMMTISDNTATNMIIARLGGIDAVNQRFRSWGLRTTQIRNALPDLEGTNMTTPKELAHLMALIYQGHLVTPRSRDRVLEIMQRNERQHLLPAGLGEGTKISHKTGDIGKMLGDTGLVELSNDKRYLATILVNRPHNDNDAEKLIVSISRAGFQQFTTGNVNTPAAAPQPSPSLSASPTTTPNPPQNTTTTTPNPPQSTTTTPNPPPTTTAPPVNPTTTIPNTTVPPSPMMTSPSTGVGNTLPSRSFQSPVTNPPPGVYGTSITTPRTYIPPVTTPMPNSYGGTMPYYQPPVTNPIPNGYGTYPPTGVPPSTTTYPYYGR